MYKHVVVVKAEEVGIKWIMILWFTDCDSIV